MSVETCSEHGAVLRAGVCPVPGSDAQHVPPAQRLLRDGGLTWTRTLSREGVWAWKVLRAKGRCLPCERARAGG